MWLQFSVVSLPVFLGARISTRAELRRRSAGVTSPISRVAVKLLVTMVLVLVVVMVCMVLVRLDNLWLQISAPSAIRIPMLWVR